jgi:hypothetical protein
MRQARGGMFVRRWVCVLVQSVWRYTRRKAELRRRCAARLAFPKRLDSTRSFGTALTVTLLFSSLFASAPLFAQSKVLVVDQSTSAEASIAINNSGDRNAVLTHSVIQTNLNTAAITNTDPVIDDTFLQLGVINQSNSVESSIAIDNSGDINAVLQPLCVCASLRASPTRVAPPSSSTTTGGKGHARFA